MKKNIIFLGSLFILLIITAVSVFAAEQSGDTLLTQESIIKQNIFAGDNYFDIWETFPINITHKYLEELYPDKKFADIGNYGIGNIIDYVGDDTIWIYYTVYIFEDNPEIKNMLTIIVCGESETGYYLAGILEGDYYSVKDFVEYLKKDPRFSDCIDMPEKDNYSPEITELNFNEILKFENNTRVLTTITLDSNNIVCVYYYINKEIEPNWHIWDLDGITHYQKLYENAGSTVYKYAIININTNEITASGELIGAMMNPSAYGFTPDGKLYIRTIVYENENDKNYVTYIDKNYNRSDAQITSPDMNPENFNYVGLHTIYSENGGLYEIMADGGKRELLPASPMVDDDWSNYYSRQYNYFHSAINNETFLYYVLGVESVPGFGVYSFKTNKATHIPDSRDKRILGRKGNLVYSTYADWASWDSTGLYITDLTTLKTSIYPASENYYGGAVISDDGKYAAFVNQSGYDKLHQNGNKEKPMYSVYIIDLDKGEKIREYFISSYTTQCSGVEFLHNGKLLVKCTNFAVDTNSVFIIDTGLKYNMNLKFGVIYSPPTGDTFGFYIILGLIAGFYIIKFKK